MITELSTIDKIEVCEDGILQIRKCNKILRDGVEISKEYFRYSLPPNSDITNEPKQVKDIATTVWTQDVVNAYLLTISNDGVTQQSESTIFDTLKQAKKQEVKNAFHNAIANGVIVYNGISIDCRRDNTNNDLQNIETLLSYMNRNNVTSIAFKDASGSVHMGITINDINNIKIMMEDYGMYIYQKKHTLEQQIDNATTEAELNNINWGGATNV